jgi:hypothetical protein
LLLVGGIGIMNITRERDGADTEIGLRRAIGATRVDIVRQFVLDHAHRRSKRVLGLTLDSRDIARDHASFMAGPRS